MREVAEESIPHPSQEPCLLKSKENLKSRSTFVVPSQATSASWSHKSGKIWDLFQSGPWDVDEQEAITFQILP